MDGRYKVLGVRIGLDPFLDLIPELGDFMGSFISCYLFYVAYRLHVPWWVYIRLARNIALDTLLGLIPFLGFIADALYHSNIMNYELLETFYHPEVIEGQIVA